MHNVAGRQHQLVVCVCVLQLGSEHQESRPLLSPSIDDFQSESKSDGATRPVTSNTAGSSSLICSPSLYPSSGSTFSFCQLILFFQSLNPTFFFKHSNYIVLTAKYFILPFHIIESVELLFLLVHFEKKKEKLYTRLQKLKKKDHFSKNMKTNSSN